MLRISVTEMYSDGEGRGHDSDTFSEGCGMLAADGCFVA